MAGKFRDGGYDGQVQYRLNGWGRSLARRLTESPAGADLARACYCALAEHLAVEKPRYARFLEGLDVARQGYADNQLARALALPIPVLV